MICGKPQAYLYHFTLCFPPLLKYLCLFVYFYDFASMHKSVNVRQTTTDDGRWQADGWRDLITCSDKDTTDRTTWTTWALLLLLPKQVHRVSMFILRFNDYYQLLSNAAVKGANEGGRRERSHAPLPPPTTTTTPPPERKATTIPPQHHRGRRRAATTGRPTTDRIGGDGRFSGQLWDCSRCCLQPPMVQGPSGCECTEKKWCLISNKEII